MDQNSHTVTRIEVLSRDLMTQLQKKPSNHLISAYNQMMQEMRNAFEQSDVSDMTLQKALDMAKHQVTHIGEVTAEEAHEIGEYIKRDINDAAEYMMETSSEFYDWLMLDIEIIERRVINLFLSVADHTRVELEQFKQSAVDSDINQIEVSRSFAIAQDDNNIPVYKSGEITGPGTLICESCGTAKAFPSSDAITDCEKCGHDRFIRGHQGKR